MTTTLYDLLFTAIKQVFRNRRKYGGAFVSAAVGIAGLATLATLSNEVESQVSMNLELLGSATIIKAEWDSYRSQRWRHGEYTLSHVQEIKKLEGVVDASAAVWKSSVVLQRDKTKFKARLAGVQAQFFRTLYLPCQAGRHFTKQESKNRSQVCVVGQGIVDQLFSSVSEGLGQKIMVENIPFEIVGILGGAEDPQYEETIIIPITIAQSRIQGLGNIYDIYVRARDWYVAKDVYKRVGQYLRDALELYAEGIYVRYYKERINSILTIVYIVKYFLLAAVLAVLLIAALAVANLMSGVVTERTPEIGLRISMGATQRLILSQFLVESLVVGVVGAVLGVVLAVFLTEFIVNIMGTEVDYLLFTRNAILCVVVGIILGAAAGFMPAKRASKMSCVEALRFE